MGEPTEGAQEGAGAAKASPHPHPRLQRAPQPVATSRPLTLTSETRHSRAISPLVFSGPIVPTQAKTVQESQGHGLPDEAHRNPKGGEALRRRC